MSKKNVRIVNTITGEKSIDLKPGYYNWSKSLRAVKEQVIKCLQGDCKHTLECPNCYVSMKPDRQKAGFVRRIFGVNVNPNANPSKDMFFVIGEEHGECNHCDYSSNETHYFIMKRMPYNDNTNETRTPVNVWTRVESGIDPEFECANCNNEKSYIKLQHSVNGDTAYICKTCNWCNEFKLFFDYNPILKTYSRRFSDDL